MPAEKNNFILTSTTDRGIKHTCASCMTRFYDLKKESPTCPQCGEKIVVVVKPVRKTRMPGSRSKNY